LECCTCVAGKVNPTALGWSDGIHSVLLLELVRTTDGRPIFGAFRSRFRLGNAATNVLLNRDLNVDPNMLQAVDSSGLVQITHRAIGAAWVRVKNEVSNPPVQGENTDWSSWMTFNSSVVNMPWRVAPFSNHGTRYVTAQYWADYSAAYFVHGSLQV